MVLAFGGAIAEEAGAPAGREGKDRRRTTDAGCPVATPPGCDQIVPISGGAITLAPQPFDNRGTFSHAVAINGHR
ncbi:MAG: hypothetical protein M3Y09_05385 [Actinomycetota bacterium]|nr:hypothetical protein [Actinomycetota bacterium]